MSDSNAPTPAPDPPETAPTFSTADLQAIGQAAAQSMRDANATPGTPEAGAAARQGAEREAESRGLEFPPEVLDKMAEQFASKTVAAMMAAFDVAQGGATPPTPPSGSPATGNGGDGISVPSESSGTTAATQDGTSTDPPPVKPSFARRLMGE